jgi:hypothetical protein
LRALASGTILTTITNVRGGFLAPTLAGTVLPYLKT